MRATLLGHGVLLSTWGSAMVTAQDAVPCCSCESPRIQTARCDLGVAMVNGGVPRCIARAAEGSSNEVHGWWSRRRKPCRNLAGLDNNDVLGAVYLLGGVVAAVLSILHLAGASNQRLMCSESIAPGAQGGAHLRTSSLLKSRHLQTRSLIS